MSCLRSKHNIWLLAAGCLFIGTCQRKADASDAPIASTPCYAIRSDDGFDDLVCNGQPAKPRPGPKGDKGDRGANGAPGERGPEGPPGSLGRVVSKTCVTDLTQWPGTNVKYIILDSSDGREAIVTLTQGGDDPGIFSNSAFFLKGDPLFDQAPVDALDFDVKLEASNRAFIRSRVTSSNTSFACR